MHEVVDSSTCDVENKDPLLSAQFIKLAEVFCHKSEDDCRKALHNLCEHHSAIPPAAVDVLVSSIWEMIPDWRHNVTIAVGPLLLSLTAHPLFSDQHARAITECTRKLLHSVVHKLKAKPGDLAVFAKFGDILAHTLAICEWELNDCKEILCVVDKVVGSPEIGDRLVAAQMLQGLAKSPKAKLFMEEMVVPRLKEMLRIGEDIILGDVVFAYACAMRGMERSLKIERVWPAIRILWYDCGVDEAVDRRTALASFCELFRHETHVYDLFNDKSQRIGEFLIDVCIFTEEECSGVEEREGDSGTIYLQYVAKEMALLGKVMAATENAEVKNEGVTMFDELCNCKDAGVVKGCDANFPTVRYYLGSGNKNEEGSRKRTSSWGKAGSCGRWRVKMGLPISLAKMVGKLRMPKFGKNRN